MKLSFITQVKNKLSHPIVKLFWLLLIVFFATHYFSVNRNQITATLQQLTVNSFAAAAAALFISKLLLVANQKLVCEYKSVSLSYTKHFFIYNITQVHKYIPGFVWQFLGKMNLYKEEGVKTRTIPILLTAEVITILVGSFAFALLAYIGATFSTAALPLFLIMTIAVYVLNTALQQKIVFLIYTTQIGIWFFQGLSLFFLLPNAANLIGSLLLVQWSNAFSFGVGYISFFAPAGIGVREVMLDTYLSQIASFDAVTVAAAHRVLYFIMDVALFSLSLKRFTEKRSKQENN